MRELPRDLVTILRIEARNQRNPPIDYVIAEDGGRMVHRPDPDVSMAELLEEVAAEMERIQKMFAAADKGMHAEAARADRFSAENAELRDLLQSVVSTCGALSPKGAAYVKAARAALARRAREGGNADG